MKKQTRPSKEQVQEMLADGTLIEQFQNMVYSIAHKMVLLHKNERFDELVSEGFWGIVRYAPKYDPKKSGLSTWIYKCAWGQMKTFCIDPKTHRHIPTDFTSPIFEVEAKESWFPKLLRELNDDAKLLVMSAIEAPNELNSIVRERAPKASKEALLQYAVDTLGWDANRINLAWSEVAECL